MKTPTLDKLVWALIYGGLFAVGLGLSVQRRAAGLGWGLVAAGSAASAVGIVLVFVRSRMKD